MPVVSVYIRKNTYAKLLAECERLQIGESELINKILEVYFRAREETDLQASTRLVLD